MLLEYALDLKGSTFTMSIVDKSSDVVEWCCVLNGNNADNDELEEVYSDCWDDSVKDRSPSVGSKLSFTSFSGAGRPFINQCKEGAGRPEKKYYLHNLYVVPSNRL